MTEQEFRNYLAAGIVCNTLWPGMKEQTPVAYLYGPDKVRLPALPEWDKTTYPYAVVAVIPPTVLKKHYTARLCFHSDINVNPTNYQYIGDYLEYTIQWNEGEDIPNSWGDVTEHEGSEWMNCMYEYVKWTNFELIASDGSWSMSASDPVPVYE